METTASAHNTVSKFNDSGTCFHADIHTFERRLHNLMSMKKDPNAAQHRPKRTGSHPFITKLKDRLKKHCNARFVLQVKKLIFLTYMI